MSINEEILQRIFSHETYTNRLSVSASNELLRTLKRSERSSIDLFNSAIEDIKQRQEEGLSTTQAVNSLVRDIKSLREESLDETLEQFNEIIDGFAEYETGFQTGILEEETEEQLSPFAIFFLVAAPVAIAAIVNAAINRPVKLDNDKAIIISESLSGLIDKESERVKSAINGGLINGDSNAVIRRSVFGTEGARAMEITRQALRGITKTAFTSVSEQSMRALATANDGLISGYYNISIIDGRTSNICKSIAARFRDKLFPSRDDIPAVPRHMNCRSRIGYTVIPWNKAGFEVRDGRLFITANTMSNRDKEILLRERGFVDNDIKSVKSALSPDRPEANITRVLSNASDEFLRDFFQSEEAFDAFKGGDLTVEQLFDSADNSPLTIEEIERKVKK